MNAKIVRIHPSGRGVIVGDDETVHQVSLVAIGEGGNVTIQVGQDRITLMASRITYCVPRYQTMSDVSAPFFLVYRRNATSLRLFIPVEGDDIIRFLCERYGADALVWSVSVPIDGEDVSFVGLRLLDYSGRMHIEPLVPMHRVTRRESSDGTSPRKTM